MKALRLLPAVALLAGSVALVAAPASASQRHDHGWHGWHGWHGHHHGRHAPASCTGTMAAPGVLTGTYTGNVVVRGVCVVNQGAATIGGSLFVSRDSAVISAFALNDTTQTGSSSLTVRKSVFVDRGATLILGCEPAFFTCLDDPGASSGPGTLSSNGVIGGDLVSTGALAVVVHATTVGRSVLSLHGGYGNSCTTPADSPSNTASMEIWAALAKSPPYSDFEDTTIGGHLLIAGLTSCWLGAARDHVAYSALLLHNTLNDPDAIEVLSNQVAGNLVCFGNTTLWNSSEANFGQSGLFPRTPEPNTVGKHRIGQCVLASPTTEGGPSGPGPF